MLTHTPSYPFSAHFFYSYVHLVMPDQEKDHDTQCFPTPLHVHTLPTSPFLFENLFSCMAVTIWLRPFSFLQDGQEYRTCGSCWHAYYWEMWYQVYHLHYRVYSSYLFWESLLAYSHLHLVMSLFFPSTRPRVLYLRFLLTSSLSGDVISGLLA